MNNETARTYKSLNDINLYQTIKQETNNLENGYQLTITIRYGNEHSNDGQFHKSFIIVKSKDKLRNPEYIGKHSYWTIKDIVKNIEDWTDYYFYSLTFETF